jgi:5-methylcytosine-specific restriction endonuclease McrA
MPYMTDGKRDYKKQNEKYDGKEPVKKDRASRNAARALLKKEGVVSKGDGKDVDHKKPLSKGGTNARTNLRAVAASKNKSFARKSNGAMK